MRRFGLSRRTFLAAIVALAAVAASALAFGPLVRGRVAGEAERRHLRVSVGGVRPAWFGVRLLDVDVRLDRTEAFAARLRDVRVSLSWRLAVEQVEVHGGELQAHGSLEDLATAVRTWRDEANTTDATDIGRLGAHAFPLRASEVHAVWTRPDGTVEAVGLGGERDDASSRAFADSVVIRTERANASVAGADLHLVDAVIRRLHAATVELAIGPVDKSPLARDDSAADGGAETARSSPAAAFALPDLHALRASAGALASAVESRLPDAAEIRIDSLSLSARHAGEPITIGPGELELTRRDDIVDVRFSSQPGTTGTALSVGALLPIRSGDVNLTLEGGPVSLAKLGLREGTAGLVDVDRATVAGKGRITLASEGDALTFDGDVRLRGCGLAEPRIARDPIHNLDLGIAARGTLDDKGDIRLDDVAANVGAIGISASGQVFAAADQFSARVHLEIPAASCQAMFESLPTALVPTLEGAHYAGTLGGHGEVAFDSRKLDELVLSYDIDDDCRVDAAPPLIARERFLKPFQHKVYLPDGSIGEETTGPGSSAWTPLGAVSPFMQVAVQTTEDGGFYHHHGFSHPAIKASVIANLKARKFLRGASTITMQLAKNLFLVREKTLSRKFEEMLLTDYLEQTFTKSELMELYLNVIEFGPDVYGIKAASYYYFGRSPAELSLAEALFLSSMLPSPLKLSGLRNEGQLDAGWQKTIVRLMEIAHKNGLISDAELEDGKDEVVVFRNTGPRGVAQRHADTIGDDGTDGVTTPARN